MTVVPRPLTAALRRSCRAAATVALVPVLGLAPLHAQAPVFTVDHAGSSVHFKVQASVPLAGKFDRWTSTLTFPSASATAGVLDLRIEATSVDTGSGLKNNKLRSPDFFAVKQNPAITFHSSRVTQTSPTSFDVAGDFTIRGISKPETLRLTIAGRGTRAGTIKGTMRFNRRDFGMTSGIPFVKIADEVDVTVDLKVRQTSGPSLVYKQ